MAYIKDGLYCSEDFYRDDEKDFCKTSKHTMPKRILLECGCNPQDVIFEKDYCDKRELPYVLDRVIIDTTCLYRPIVKIDFSSLVYFSAEGKHMCDQEVEVDLKFELERICKGNKESVQSWRYKKRFAVNGEKIELKISEPFTVTFCDKICSDCCEYRMVVKVKDLKGKFDALRVVKPSLSALAQSLCGD